MPIVYDETVEGWMLKEPTDKELQEIQELGIKEFTKKFSNFIVEQSIAHAEAVEQAKKIPEEMVN